mgnify:CR=1 FL=1
MANPMVWAGIGEGGTTRCQKIPKKIVLGTKHSNITAKNVSEKKTYLIAAGAAKKDAQQWRIMGLLVSLLI